MQQRQKNRSTLLRFFLVFYVFGSILGSCTLFDLNGRLAAAFVSSSLFNGATTSMKTGDKSDHDDGDGLKKSNTPQSESVVVVSETGAIEPSNDAGPIPLLLPAGDESNENVTSIKLGETISFAELGPIILNTDGTTRRIDNWNALTKQEQETTWRRIQKRNAERREKLLSEQEKQKEVEKSINQSNPE